ncbi:MAG: TauD/TfdA family dioxygenase [Rhodocyclaceae bacterium]|nr:TauD/TfdA family dioxygenase [Rhodocyclaceae bacterium]
MADDVHADIAMHGYSFLPKFLPGVPTHDAFSKLGQVELVDGFQAIQMLVPKRMEDATPNTYSGNFGTQTFPLHTDLAHWAVPPRYVALRCQEGSTAVATLILDSRNLIQEIGEEHMSMSLLQPRRPFHGYGIPLLRLLEKTKETIRLRWDPIYLKPANSFAAPIFEATRQALQQAPAKEVFLSDIGDTLIFDNWRMLHGRSPVPDGTNRRIERAYIGELI